MVISSLTLLDEGFVSGVITTLKAEDSMRYCEDSEVKERVAEILKNEGWNEDKIVYWLEWLKGWIEK